MRKTTIEEVLQICMFTGGKPETITYNEVNFFDSEKLLNETSCLVGTFEVPKNERVYAYLKAYASSDPENGNFIFIMDDLIPLLPKQNRDVSYTCFTFSLPEEHLMVMACIKANKTLIPFGPFRSSAAKRFTVFVPMNGTIVPRPVFIPFSYNEDLEIIGINFSFEWF